MLCDDCGVRPANFILKAVTENGVHEKNLCPVCMAKYQNKIPGLDFSNLAGILSGILKKQSTRETEPESDENDMLECEGCGMTYAEFRKAGKLGCPQCYTSFRKPLEGLILKLHGNTQHAGRIPGGLENDAAILLNIEKLKQDLVKAIAAEEYEQAAQIRDQVRALTARLKGADVND